MDQAQAGPTAAWELLISRRAREEYGIDEAPSSGVGVHGVRLLAQRINRHRTSAATPAQPIAAGQLNALRLIEESLFRLLDGYRQRHGDDVLLRAFGWLEERFAAERVQGALALAVDLYPPNVVYRTGLEAEPYLAEGDAQAKRMWTLERLVVLWLVEHNPAAASLSDLFDDGELEDASGYRQMVASLRGFFARHPGVGTAGTNFFDLLQSPSRERPDSLAAQLELLVRVVSEDSEGLGLDLGELGLDDLVEALQLGVDVLREEDRPFLPGPGGGPPEPEPAEVLTFVDLAEDEQRFTEDRDWMPELVLLAKNALVWLDQLSHFWERPIRRLDEIPDEELDRMAAWGFTGLWLIGIFERSRASERIKQLCGNPEAAASAYSLREYRVAEELGGEAALETLRHRAWKRRIRLACDMVPNHMGIDSEWLVERPDLFLSLPKSPFPNYSFNGPELSSDPRVSVRLEDHYYDRSDAAVVFKRTDQRTGEQRFVYHGNDGTSMPWNDTAQLDYLNPETREAIIEVILEVARRFPIIRFDAAMTLARRHVQRLWYPAPGHGGAIPSRAEHGLPREEFLHRMPEEFWREVVDRVAEEAPDTLLLAEAFWLMEGYFVRTLGMHRVYNSAFMHMLRDEDNEGFRSTLKNTLEFDPEVLKRFVNYVTNPDEKSAVEQLGKGEKYFGVCTLMATLPGLPMFGHGQFEGLAEKYGMEYRRAYADERPDPWVVARHEREIVPLLERRYLFAGVESFRLYDAETADGNPYEHLIAFSNRFREQRVLVLYHNRATRARCWIRHSTPWRAEEGADGLRRTTVAEALGVVPAADLYCRFRDQTSGLEYLLPSHDLWGRGLMAEMGPYERRILMGFELLQDESDGRYRQLVETLGGRGVPDLDAALEEILVRPVQLPVRGLLHGELLERLWRAREAPPEPRRALLDEVEGRARRMLAEIRPLLGDATMSTGGEAEAGDELEGVVAAQVRSALDRILALEPSALEPAQEAENETPPREPPSLPVAEAGAAAAVGGKVATDVSEEAAEPDDGRWPALLAWAFLRPLGRLFGGDDAAARSRALVEVWMLDRVLEEALRELGHDTATARLQAAAAKLFVGRQEWYQHLEEEDTAGSLLASWLLDEEVETFLGVHDHGGVRWFRREPFRLLLWWLAAVAEVGLGAAPKTTLGDTERPGLDHCRSLVAELGAAEIPSGYSVETLMSLLGGEGSEP